GGLDALGIDARQHLDVAEHGCQVVLHAVDLGFAHREPRERDDPHHLVAGDPGHGATLARAYATDSRRGAIVRAFMSEEFEFEALPEPVRLGVAALGWTRPMPVQVRGVPMMRAG